MQVVIAISKHKNDYYRTLVARSSKLNDKNGTIVKTEKKEIDVLIIFVLQKYGYARR